MQGSLVERVRQAFRSRSYRLTEHAEGEREVDAITVSEMEEALGSDEVELLEEYREDVRGLSALFLWRRPSAAWGDRPFAS